MGDDLTPSWAGAYTPPKRSTAATDAKIAAAVAGLIGSAPADRDTFGEVAGILAQVLTQSQVDARIIALTALAGRTGAYADLAGKPALFSGAYADLTGKPSLFSGAYADLIGKPSLFSGAYADLTGKPTIPSTALTNATLTMTSGFTLTSGYTFVLNKDPNNRVTLQFAATKSSAYTSSDVIATIPTGFRPSAALPPVQAAAYTSAWGAKAQVYANAAGQLSLVAVDASVTQVGATMEWFAA